MYSELDEDYSGILNWTQVYVNIGINAALFGIYSYAHVAFVIEVKRGTMTTELYTVQEKASCCCV